MYVVSDVEYGEALVILLYNILVCSENINHLECRQSNGHGFLIITHLILKITVRFNYIHRYNKNPVHAPDDTVYMRR